MNQYLDLNVTTLGIKRTRNRTKTLVILNHTHTKTLVTQKPCRYSFKQILLISLSRLTEKPLLSVHKTVLYGTSGLISATSLSLLGANNRLGHGTILPDQTDQKPRISRPPKSITQITKQHHTTDESRTSL